MMKESLATDQSSWARELRQVGLRVTAPRLAILELLRQDPCHPTAELIHARLRPLHPGLSLSTVYNTLETFSRCGLCRRLPPLEGSRRYDGTLQPHHHAHCVRCGRIFDIPVETYHPLPPPPPRLGELEIRGVQVTFEVTCAACRRLEGGALGGVEPPQHAAHIHTQQGGVICPS